MDYSTELDCFLSLCYKAQHITFENLMRGNYMACWAIDNQELPKLTPIEQIFYVQSSITAYNNNFAFNLIPQQKIQNGNKCYIVDFLINSVYFRDNLVKLNKPLVIELDGKDYHSSTKQMNYDYARENDLKLLGYDIIRFTGSQIYNDTENCVKKVAKYLNIDLVEE